MVVSTTMAWLADFGTIKRSLAHESKKLGHGLSLGLGLSQSHHRNNNHRNAASRQDKSPPAKLGILAFETAKTMSRLVSLYKSLSDNELSRLRREVMRSEGVSYLNSKDQDFLINLACAERLEELDRVAVAVVRLGRKCSDFGLTRFDLVYNDLKIGIIDIGKLEYATKNIEKIIEKMEKYIAATSSLYGATESLTEMEISERKLNRWRKNLGSAKSQKANFDLFDNKLAYQKKQVRHFKDISLWNQTFDKSVGLMARIVCIVYARICTVFAPFITGLPRLMSNKCGPPVHERHTSKSGPMPKTSSPKSGLGKFHGRELSLFLSDDIGFRIGRNNENKRYLFLFDTGKNNRVFSAAPPSTVGGSGLALRYANVIMLAETYLNSTTSIGEDARIELYHMLPENVRLTVRSKLRKTSGSKEDDESLAEGWREALGKIMGWLAPMAQDTLRWQAERNFEKQKFDAKPTVLLLQTLHYSDKEKTEAAIADVLVGLSCIYRYENHLSYGGWGSWDSSNTYS